MKMNFQFSIKREQIEKAGNTMLVVVTVAVVLSVFSLFSAKALLAQSSYQRKVLSGRHAAVDQLKKNIDAAATLTTQYQVFVDGNPNLIGGIGGSSPGNGPSDGDNARIVLDGLPSEYDFPALISSIEKIVKNDRIAVQGIAGTDQGDSATTPVNSSEGGVSQPVPIQISIDAIPNYSGVQTLLKDLERSIRPFDITSLQLSGSEKSMHLTITANTYYQPAMTLDIGHKVVN